MRILHVWNPAGVASIIAKYMDRLYGTKSLVVFRRAYDRFGTTVYGVLWDCGAKTFVLRVIFLARRFDLVHVHSLDRIVPLLKLIYPRKPVVLHYHGSEIRGRWRLRRRYWMWADAILYSTPDLCDSEAPACAVYVPNPVDTELFRRLDGVRRRRNMALAFNYNLDLDRAMRYARRYGLSVELLGRGIPYRELPRLLNKYEYYIDRTSPESLSKTALEALACGLKVIRWDGRVVFGLPLEHRPERVVGMVWRIYEQIGRKGSFRFFP